MMDKTPNNDSKASHPVSVGHAQGRQIVTINGAPLEWNHDKGTLSIFGVESTLLWKDPSLTYLFKPLVKEVGVELFRLLVASSSSLNIEELYQSMLESSDFKAAFEQWGSVVAVSGWGRFYLLEYEPERCHAVIRIDNPWELAPQKGLPENQQWGCPFLQGKMIGIFSRAMGQNCWSSELCHYDGEETSVVMTIYPSHKTIDNELDNLRKLSLTQQAQRLQEEIDRKTTELQTSHDILENIAQLDFLTNLKNRRSFESALSTIAEDGSWNQHVLMFVDLDQFKVINDTCGHLSGDRLLTIVSAKLVECIGTQNHSVFRYGGDEFTLLLNTTDIQNAINLAHNARKAISDIRFDWEGRIYQISCSIGLVPLFDLDAKVDAAIIAADDACYQAKMKGRNQVVISDACDVHVENRLSQMNWVHRIREAVNNDQFEIHFQIIKPLNGDSTIALEALIRMIDKDTNELIMPFKFLPAAEHYGVIYDIDCWVIEHIFQKLQSLGNNDYLESIAINLSGNTLANPGLEGFIDDCFERYQVDPTKICFELTETHMMLNIDNIKSMLSKLQKHGCTVSLDDFGAGMSSFGYLRNLPVNKIKIDGSFVKDMHESLVDYTFVESITNVARAMKIKTVAEFVENERIAELLEDMMVDYAQGYHIAKPQPWAEIFPE